MVRYLSKILRKQVNSACEKTIIVARLSTTTTANGSSKSDYISTNSRVEKCFRIKKSLHIGPVFLVLYKFDLIILRMQKRFLPKVAS